MKTDYFSSPFWLVALKQKRRNYGIHEFVLRAFDLDDNVIGRFDDRSTDNLFSKYHTCTNGANVNEILDFSLPEENSSSYLILGRLCGQIRR